MKSRIFFLSFSGIILLVLFAFNQSQKENIELNATLTIKDFYKNKLTACLNIFQHISSESSLNENRTAYKEARKIFKELEPIMAYVATGKYESLNQANLVGIEELGAGKFAEEIPFGFQVTEEILFSETIDESALQQNLEKTKSLLNELIEESDVELSSAEILTLIRNQIVRIATLGITGFDSPEKQSLKESAYSYKTIEKLLEINASTFKSKELYNKWIEELNQMQELLSSDFDSFDRYTFIQNHTHHQLELIQQTTKEWGLKLPEDAALHPEATSLFAKNSFQADFYVKSDFEPTEERLKLGEQLFNDVRFSKSGAMSCATCHQKKNAFTDGLIHFEGQKRNTPTLLYAGLQNEYFYDMRSGSLQEQIVQVIVSENEFHSDLEIITQKVISDSIYAEKFRAAYQKETSEELVLDALSQYVKSLNPFDSKFDRNINEAENTLTASEKNGFNLFMGKAECGTCHFAPIFNGTVPPYFTTTEMELLGVPKDSTNLEVDVDFGRYDVYVTENRKHFFKTPTVRNVSKTAPYMHNGAYTTLFEVVEFYDDGGGVGLGFNLPFQTLPSDSLHLSETEIQDIIAFLNSLEDEPKDNKNLFSIN